MLKSEKSYRAGTVFLVLGIIFAVVTLVAAFIHCTAYSWMPFELVFKMPFEILLEYVLIGAGVTLILLGSAWICYGVASARAKRETDMMYGEDDYYFEDDEEDVKAAPAIAAAVTVAPVAAYSAAPKKNVDFKKTAMEWKDKITAGVKSEKVQKVGKIVVPAVAACVVTAAVFAAVQNGQKAKHRREFYRWLG